MNFLTPSWLYALLAIPPLLVASILVHRSRSKAWKGLVAQRLQDRLIQRRSNFPFWLSLAFALVAYALTVLALARPFFGEVTHHEKISSKNILLAIDTSKSMLCQDVSSDRLTSAKALALQLMERLPKDRFAVLAFAGSSRVIAPLSINHIAIQDTISQLDIHSIPLGGSNLREAALLGIATLAETGQRSNAMIILTDGEEHDGNFKDIKKQAALAGVRIFCIGIGTLAGGVIPDPDRPGEKLRDRKGSVVHTKLEPKSLQELASSTGGMYFSQDADPERALLNAISKMESYEQEGREQVVPKELYAWFLLPAVICMLLSALLRTHWRASAIPMAISFFALFPQENQAAEWIDNSREILIDRPATIKSAYSELKQQNYEKAAALFEKALQHGTLEQRAHYSQALGDCYYKSNQFKQAISAYSLSLLSSSTDRQRQAYHNLGNSLYKQEWSKLKQIGKTPLDKYLRQAVNLTPPAPQSDQIKIPKLTRKDLDALEHGFINAEKQYQNSIDLRPTQEASKNLELTQKVIKTIRKIKKELDQKQDDKNKDPNNNGEPKDDDGKQGDGKEGDGKQGDGKQGDGKQGDGKEGDGKEGDGKEGDGKQGDGKQGDGKQGDGKQGDGKQGDGKEGDGKQGDGKEGDGKQGDGKEGDGKEGDGKEGDGKEGDGKEGDGKEGDGKEGDGKEGDGKEGDGKEGDGKEGDGIELDPMDRLKRHADMQRRPSGGRNSWFRQPDIDW